MINIADFPIFGRTGGPCSPRPPQGRGGGVHWVPTFKLGMKLWGIFLQKQRARRLNRSKFIFSVDCRKQRFVEPDMEDMRALVNSLRAGRSYERVEPYEDFYWTPALLSAKLHVSEKTVWRWIRERRLRAYRVGRLLRIPNSAVQEFLERGQTMQGTIPGARISY